MKYYSLFYSFYKGWLVGKFYRPFPPFLLAISLPDLDIRIFPSLELSIDSGPGNYYKHLKWS